MIPASHLSSHWLPFVLFKLKSLVLVMFNISMTSVVECILLARPRPAHLVFLLSFRLNESVIAAFTDTSFSRSELLSAGTMQI